MKIFMSLHEDLLISAKAVVILNNNLSSNCNLNLCRVGMRDLSSNIPRSSRQS
jgi:hypothetical protein